MIRKQEEEKEEEESSEMHFAYDNIGRMPILDNK